MSEEQAKKVFNGIKSLNALHVLVEKIRQCEDEIKEDEYDEKEVLLILVSSFKNILSLLLEKKEENAEKNKKKKETKRLIYS